jgi:type II pantothenate kinase
MSQAYSWLCCVTDADKYSWLENYAGSSGLRSPIPSQVLSAQGVPVDQLEIDRWESAVTYCPLLHDPANYVPDTVDLTQDTEARYQQSFFFSLHSHCHICF